MPSIPHARGDEPFKSPPSLKRKEEIEADEIKQRMVFERMLKGIISADDAARELGYEKAYRNDMENERVSFDFDRSLNKYVFNRPTVSASLAKKKRRKSIESYEADYASRFFEILDAKFSEVIDEVEECLHEDDPAEALMNMVREKLEIELGDETEKLSREINSEVYFQELRNKVDVSRHSVSFATGVDFDGHNGEWKVADQTAIDWFVKNDKFFFSKQYSHYMEDLKEVVVNELKGVEKAYSKAVVDRMKEKMGDAFEHPTVKNYYDLVVRNAVNRSRNYARAYKFQRAGIAEMEVVAVIDRKTSAICREMNGRRISTETAVEYVNQTMESPLDELTEKFAWSTPKDVLGFRGKSTVEILEKLNCKLPPYHGRCRTTTVMSVRTRVTNSSGTALNNFKKPALKGLGKKRSLEIRSKNEKRLEEYKGLTIDEWSSKINASQGAQWDRDNLNKHFDDHLNDFAKISTLSFVKTEDEYEKFSKKLLADFNRVFIYMENDGNRLMFYNKEFDSVVIVDSSTNGIVSCYPLRDGMKQKYVSKYMELVNGKEEYN